jgi:hypothetical protein
MTIMAFSHDFSISFLERVLQPMATRFLKKWSGLARPANPSLLFLPPRKGGLGLPTLTGLYKKQQSALKVQLLLSHDHSVRAIAKHQLCLETANNRQKFRPSETAQLVMDAHPGVHRKVLVKRVRNLIAAEEGEELATSLHALPQQGGMARHFEGNAAAVWAKCLEKLPPEPLRFALNAAVDTLPTNCNLHRWGKRPSAMCPLCNGSRQSLQHVLNNCSKSMELRRYSDRHDQVLHILSSFVKRHLPPSFSMTTDLHDQRYLFPQHITPTTLWPDIVWWSEEKRVLWLCELTISYETVMDDTHSRKLAKYDDLVKRVREVGYQAGCIAVEVGSRGLLVEDELSQIQDILRAPGRAITELAASISRAAILGSFRIWCSRNRVTPST